MAAGHRNSTLHEKQAAVRVAGETNNREAARRFSVLIVSNIGGRFITEVDLFPEISGKQISK